MSSPFVYLPGARLSQAELTAACLDGDLIALGDAFVPADVVETTALRAASLAGLLGDALAATHLSAVWVHGGADDPPARHTVQRAVPRRLHHMIDRRFVYRDTCVAAEDLERRGGALVTTVPRTVADLARMPGAEHAEALRVWAARDHAILAHGLDWIAARPRLPHGRTAERLIDRIQDDVTR